MKTKILIIEHDSNDMESIQDELKKGNDNFITEIVKTKKEYTNALNTFKPDIILSNYTFHTFDGLTALKIREELVPQTPFIFISESIDAEKTKGIIKNGVVDFVLKKRLDTLIDKMNLALKGAELNKINTLLLQSEERRTAEMFQNESKYQFLVESSIDAILLTVKDGRILTANAAACEIFEMTEQEIINAGRFGLADLADPRLKPLLEERQRTGRAKGELTLVRKNGHKFPAELSSNVFKDSNGEERTSMVIRDISERKQAEDKQIATSNALRQTLNDLNNILDSSLDVICSFDEEGRFASVNAASECLWGYTPEELVGKKYIDFVFYEDAKSTLAEDLKIRSGVPVTMFENRYLHKNGIIVPMLWSSRWDEDNKKSYAIAKNATEKKNLEKAFEIERKRFHDLYSQAPSCMGILKGPNHAYEMVNPLYLQLIDKKEDIIGKTVKEVLPELEGQGIFKFLDTVYQTGETFSANEMLVKFDHYGNGKLVDTYLNFIYQAHRDVEGNIDGILFFANDVTEQVISRKKIEESEKRYRELIETAQEGIWFVDENNKTTFVNEKMCQILEYTQTEMMGQEIYSFMDEKGKKIASKLIRERQQGESDQGHFKYISKSGKEIWTNVAANPIFDETYIFKGSLAMITDITEIKKAQKTLKRNEKKYRYLFDNNPMPMWIIDEITSKFLDVNEMAILRYGYSREEFLSLSAIDIRPEEDKERFRQLNNSSEIDEKNFYRGILNHIKKDGTVIPVEIIAHKIIYEGVSALFILSNDITDRKKAEVNLEKRNKELVKTNAELDRFVYSVSHDLRSPLTSILGLLSFIEGETQEPDTLQHAEMIHKSINRLDDFIKNILSYSRNNRTGLQIEEISIQETVRSIVDSLQSMEDAKEIHYEIDIREQQPFFSDALRFNTIIENLISNAIKHHKKDKSGRYIKITGKSDHEKLEFTVADNGIGIAPENHQKIFDMFFRLSGETDGSGIGLYIVKDAVEKMQGTLEVHSEKEIGTSFIIKLKNLKP